MVAVSSSQGSSASTVYIKLCVPERPVVLKLVPLKPPEAPESLNTPPDTVTNPVRSTTVPSHTSILLSLPASILAGSVMVMF